MNKIKNKKLIITFLIFVFLLTTGAQCGLGLPDNTIIGYPDPVKLTYWKVWEESDNIKPLIDLYVAQNPQVTIEYKNFTYDEYEEELIKAFALDRGPDIFSVHTTWMKKYQEFIQPMPAQITIPYSYIEGTIKKETYTRFEPKETISQRKMRELFPDVVLDNQIINNQVYGLPLSVDTLGLFYNRDLLNNSGIIGPAKTWQEFQDQIDKLTKLDNEGNIIQSGAGIGTANNITRSADLLSLLMMQSGAQMTDANGLPTFANKPVGYTREIPPAHEALIYYTSYASPLSQNYTWDENQPEAMQAFMQGKTAYYFGYAYNIAQIKAQAPKLNLEVAQVPQLNNNPKNLASYWAETVSKKSKNTDQAWDFVMFMTTNVDYNYAFVNTTQKPAAMLSLIEKQIQDDDLYISPFASQILTSQSWYKGYDAPAADQVFKEMINLKLEGTLEINNIISQGAKKISQTYAQ